MFEDILGEILDIEERKQVETPPDAERSSFEDDGWDTGAGDTTWSILNTPTQDKIWRS